MSNKFVDKSILEKLWEDIEMKRLDFVEFMKEKFIEEGVEKGREEAREESAREMTLAVLESAVGNVPEYIVEKIKSIKGVDILKQLVKQAVRCDDYVVFEKELAMVTSK